MSTLITKVWQSSRLSLRLFWRSLLLIWIMLLGVLMAVLFLRNTMSPDGVSAKITQRWHQQICRIFNIDINVYGTPPQEPMLLAVNHISWFDISALGSVISARYLSKYEVVGWPIIGWLAKKAGTLFIKRGTRDSAISSMQKMSEAMTAGDHVVLFPEGTTTDGTKIRKFHARLFQSAIDSQNKIQPVLIRYPHENGVHPKAPFVDDITLYESAIGMLGEPHMRVDIYFLDPVDTKDQSRKQLAQVCEDLLQDKLLQLTSTNG